MLSVSLGPLALSLGTLLVIIALAIALVVGWVSARAPEQRVGTVLLDAALVALVAARAGFVLHYYPEYAEQPLGALDIRDGGFMPGWGVAAGGVLLAGWLWRRPAKRRPLVSAVAAGGVFWLLTAGVIQHLEQRSRGLPETALTNLQGNAIRLARFSGQPMVVNLWASWCAPCRREMPVLARAQAERDDTVFVFVNQGEAPSTVRRYIAEAVPGLDHVLLDRSRALAATVGARGLPATLFYAADGTLQDVHLGALSRATLADGLQRIEPEPGETSTSR